jgi:enoyl-CoA hydratase/carnithine racemase
MTPNEFTDICYRKEDSGLVTITINRPEIKNALTIRVVMELFYAAEAFEKDPRAGVALITGARPPGPADPAREAFSSGAYFNPAEVQAISALNLPDFDPSDIALKKLCLKWFGINKPLVAAINGLAIGGGFTIPLACADLIYVSEHAWVRLPFGRLGLTPELASSFLMPRLIGLQKTKEIFFFGEKLEARQLLELGLVNKVLPHDQLLPYAREMALRLVPPYGAPLAIHWTKEILHKPLIESLTQALDRENEMLNRAFGTEDFFEALSARLEKREPVFKGK